MAIADFGGSVNGKKIELISADHQNKPDVGSAIANQWFGNDGVDAIVDVPTSSVALAVQEVARNKNKVFLISGAAASDLTGKACSPTSVHWTYDTVALANGTGAAVVKAGGDTWFFITADYAFGHALERDTSRVVEENGGKVLGSVRAPLNTADFSSFLLQAQNSKAKIIGLANAGGDTINSIKQAGEFGIVEGGQKLAGLLVFISDIHSLGLQAAHGLQLTSAFYWDQNDETRAWSKRFMDKMKREPTMVQAGVYGAIMHYLAAIKATGSDDGPTVVKQMKATPVNDFMTKNGKIREDGTLVRDMYLFEVKKPQVKRSLGLLQADRSNPRRGSLQAARPQPMPAGQGLTTRLRQTAFPARIICTAPHRNNQHGPVLSVRCRSRPPPANRRRSCRKPSSSPGHRRGSGARRRMPLRREGRRLG